jgi:G3E family GTPase
MMSRIPLTLITGYLGAGKTTLLNALLRDASAGRIAVVVNEFGDVGLDHDLIVETTEETVLLSSGCMCCTVRGDLVQALEGLFERRSAGKLDFDRIVIETTGLADPAPILHTLIVTPGLAWRCGWTGSLRSAMPSTVLPLWTQGSKVFSRWRWPMSWSCPRQTS